MTVLPYYTEGIGDIHSSICRQSTMLLGLQGRAYRVLYARGLFDFAKELPLEIVPFLLFYLTDKSANAPQKLL